MNPTTDFSLFIYVSCLLFMGVFCWIPIEVGSGPLSPERPCREADEVLILKKLSILGLNSSFLIVLGAVLGEGENL